MGGAVALNLLFGVPLVWGGLITGAVSLALLVLALQDEVPVGMLVAVETGHLGASPDLFVYGIRVREDLRGMGIAHRLVEKAVEVAEEAGCSKVWGSMQVPDDLTQDPPSAPPEGTTAESSTFVIPIP